MALVPHGLGPRGPTDEAERIGQAAYAGAADAPEHAAVCVGDDHHLADVYHRRERGAQPGHQPGQRARRTTALQLVVGQRGNGRLGARVQAAGCDPAPGGGDLGPG
ncbi:MAG: hypothetical protein ABJA81_12460 [Nocardioidaceae bacterium]